MRTRTIAITALAAMLASMLCGQDIVGDWQGTLKGGPQELRTIIEIAKGNSFGWKALIHSIDQTTEVVTASSVTLEGSTIKMVFGLAGATYEGNISTDGASITGSWTGWPASWTQRQPSPLELRRATKETAWQRDPTPHGVQFLTVDSGVKLEVLDWGGAGRPLVFLAGMGNTAHIFDEFAPKLTPSYHVYGITRRGFGASSSPDFGYSADRLGDDVLAVIDSLKLNRPVLIGHSFAGEELSSIGSRHPEKVAGLIYLDAGFSYAYYNPPIRTLDIDVNELRRQLDRLQSGIGPGDAKQLTRDLQETILPDFERDLMDNQKALEAIPAAMIPVQLPPPGPIAQAMVAGEQKYTSIPAPILGIFAVPHNSGDGTTDPASRVIYEARDQFVTESTANAFENGIPSARVVRLPHANHFIFESNSADVLREMKTFIGGLR